MENGIHLIISLRFSDCLLTTAELGDICKQAIALEQKQSRQQDKQKQQPGSGATIGNPAASSVTAESQRLRNEAEALYRNALEIQTTLHGRNHAYSTKTAQRLESLRRGGDQAHCPYSLA